MHTLTQNSNLNSQNASSKLKHNRTNFQLRNHNVQGYKKNKSGSDSVLILDA